MNVGRHTFTRLVTTVVVLAAVLAGLIAAQSAAAAAPPADWRLNGPVSAVVHAGNRIILGGSFDYLGPVTGSGAAVSTSTGELLQGFPLVEGGDVYVVIDDGAGGFYVGGDFTTVGGVARHGLAHLFEDGRVDQAWEASIDGDVYALAVGAGRVYAGGHFREGERQRACESRRLRRLHGSARSVEPLAHRRGVHAGVRGHERVRGRRLHPDCRGGAQSNRKPRCRDRRARADLGLRRGRLRRGPARLG